MTVSRMSPDADPSGRSDFQPVSAFSALFVGDQLRIMCILEVKKNETKLRCFLKTEHFPQVNVAIPVERFLEGPRSNQSLRFVVAGESFVVGRVHINYMLFRE